MKTSKSFAKVEIRQRDKGPRLHGVLVQEGRAASGGRAELFAPGSVLWPDEGVSILIGHGGRVATTAHPARHPSGEIRIAVPANDQIVEAVQSGRDGLSVEFVALRENRTAGGVREIERAFVDGAALVSEPEYGQARAELRAAKKGIQIWL